MNFLSESALVIDIKNFLWNEVMVSFFSIFIAIVIPKFFFDKPKSLLKVVNDTINSLSKWTVNKLNGKSMPSTFFAEIILPSKDAEFIITELERLHESRFLPRYGKTRAKIIFYAEVLKAAFSCYWAGLRKFLLDWRHKPTRK